MSAGDVIRRPRIPPRQPEIRLAAWSPLKSVEPLLQYLQTTAAQTLEIQDRQLDELQRIREQLEQLVQLAKAPLKE
jgi:hypothetical protein